MSRIDLQTLITSDTVLRSTGLIYCVWNDNDYVMRPGDFVDRIGKNAGAKYRNAAGFSVTTFQTLTFSLVEWDYHGWTDPTNSPGIMTVPPFVTHVNVYLLIGDHSTQEPDQNFVMYHNSYAVGAPAGSEYYRTGWNRMPTYGCAVFKAGPIRCNSGDKFWVAHDFGNTKTLGSSCWFQIQPVGFQ